MALGIVIGREDEKSRAKIERFKVLLLVIEELDENVIRIWWEIGIVGRWVFEDWSVLWVFDDGNC